MVVVNGSTNFKMSLLSDHATTDGHTRAIREQGKEKVIVAGLTVAPRKVQETPTYSAIGAGFKRMGETEKIALKKLFDIPVKWPPFTDFKDHIKLEKIHGVKFQFGSIKNESSCRDFIKANSEFFFKKDIYEKILRVNFIAILCDGTTDTIITEQEVTYVFFVDPDTIEPTLTFFECPGLESSQDASSILDAIKVAFEKFNLSSLFDKVVFLSSDGASVNSGKKSGLMSLYRERNEWMTFRWCFSDRLELAVRDSLKYYTSPIDESLLHLFSLYKNSSKKHRELKKLYQLMKDEFEMHGSEIKPIKSTGTRWIGHRIYVMLTFGR